MSQHDRRNFLTAGAAVALGAAISPAHAGDEVNKHQQAASRLTVPEPIVSPVLPYAQDALQPHISAETLSYHYGKHHTGYFTKLVDLLQGKHAEYDLPTLIQMMGASLSRPHGRKPANAQDIYNAAGQLWAHNFYWRSLAPNPTSTPRLPAGALETAIDRSFGSYAAFTDQLAKAAASLFGSGWVWLVSDSRGNLSIINTSNADTPLTMGLRPILVIDVWEHAYYIDQRNKRPSYVSAVIQNLLNWDFAQANYTRA